VWLFTTFSGGFIAHGSSESWTKAVVFVWLFCVSLAFARQIISPKIGQKEMYLYLITRCFLSVQMIASSLHCPSCGSSSENGTTAVIFIICFAALHLFSLQLTVWYYLKVSQQ
jgi:hypothetical protein